MTNECSICEFLEEPTHQVLTTEYWTMGLNNDQAYLGQARIALRKHKPNITDISQDELQDLHAIMNKITKAYKEVFGTLNINWAVLGNKEHAKEQPNPHLYIHFFPRYKQSVEFAGETFTDEAFGRHYKTDKTKIVTDEALSLINSAIEQRL